jgi:hypothetical protein
MRFCGMRLGGTRFGGCRGRSYVHHGLGPRHFAGSVGHGRSFAGRNAGRSFAGRKLFAGRNLAARRAQSAPPILPTTTSAITASTAGSTYPGFRGWYGYGWYGPVFWPFAYDVLFADLFWGYAYGYPFWDYGYPNLFGALFWPYGYDDLAGYLSPGSDPIVGTDAGMSGSAAGAGAIPASLIHREAGLARHPMGRTQQPSRFDTTTPTGILRSGMGCFRWHAMLRTLRLSCRPRCPDGPDQFGPSHSTQVSTQSQPRPPMRKMRVETNHATRAAATAAAATAAVLYNVES